MVERRGSYPANKPLYRNPRVLKNRNATRTSFTQTPTASPSAAQRDQNIEGPRNSSMLCIPWFSACGLPAEGDTEIEGVSDVCVVAIRPGGFAGVDCG